MLNRLEVITGPMCSGKSEALASAYMHMSTLNLKIGAFQPEQNTRDNGIVSRTGLRVPANKITSPLEIDPEDFDVIILDEGHMFDADALAKVCIQARDAGKTALVGILDYSYMGTYMAGYEQLMAAKPDHVDYLTAWCSEPDGCDNPARFTALFIDGVQQFEGEQTIVGDVSQDRLYYSPRCSRHFMPLVSLDLPA